MTWWSSGLQAQMKSQILTFCEYKLTWDEFYSENKQKLETFVTNTGMVHLHQCYESLMMRQVNFIQTFLGFLVFRKAWHGTLNENGI